MLATSHSAEAASDPGAGWLFANFSPRALGRMTSAGLSVVLIFLASFAVWGAITTRNAAIQVKQSNEMSDLYQQARFAVASEESLERKYRLEPSPEVAAKHAAAAADLVQALQMASARGDTAEQISVAQVVALHHRYLDASGRMFAAINAGDTALVLDIDNNEADPVFSTIETSVDQAAELHRAQAVLRLSELDQTESLVFITTPIVFTVGLLMLLIFWNILRSFQQRLDLAGQRELQREIERVKSVAERDAALAANRAKSTFLATMSHELRTPLSSILGYSELLQMRAERFGYQNMLEDIQKIWSSGRHLLALINDVLDLSKIEAGKMQLFIEPLTTRELLDEVLAATQPLAAKNMNSLTLEVADHLPSMRTDITKVRQVLLNLLSNAAKFTSNGAIVLRVEQEQRANGDWIQFSVSDTGIGMQAEEIQRLFQPFTQADASTSRKYGGTGLGLSLCKHLCELLGGQIAVHSTLGIGSTFVVSLPATTADPSDSGAQPRPGLEAGESDMFEGYEDISAVSTVLVIDDDPHTREIITRHLIGAGMNVECACSGAEGLELAYALLPSAIILDVVMPGMDGWEVLTTCKADPLLADIPIIMLSIIDDKTKGFALGVTEYLVKPVESERLVRLLQPYDRAAELGPGVEDRLILVVEDDATLRAMLRQVLSGAGWGVVDVASGQAALDWIAANQPALIILDLMLPELDGIQLLDQLNTMPNGQGTPVVVVTAKDLTSSERAKLNGSVAQILQKGDYRLDDLLVTVRELVIKQVQRQSFEYQETIDD